MLIFSYKVGNFQICLLPIMMLQCLYKKPGAAEADLASMDTAEIMKFILSYRIPGPLIMPKGKLFDPSTQQVALPSWISEEDINYYTSKFRKTGFTGGINYYRCLDL